MHDAAHIMMILDIATSPWLIDFCLSLRSRLRNFVADIKILLRNTRSEISQGNSEWFISNTMFVLQIAGF